MMKMPLTVGTGSHVELDGSILRVIQGGRVDLPLGRSTWGGAS